MKRALDGLMSRPDTAKEGSSEPEHDKRNFHSQKAEKTKTEEKQNRVYENWGTTTEHKPDRDTVPVRTFQIAYSTHRLHKATSSHTVACETSQDVSPATSSTSSSTPLSLPAVPVSHIPLLSSHAPRAHLRFRSSAFAVSSM